MAVLAVLTSWIVHDDVADVPSVLVEVIGTDNACNARLPVVQRLGEEGAGSIDGRKANRGLLDRALQVVSRILGQELIADRDIAAPRVHRRLAAIQPLRNTSTATWSLVASS